MRWTIAFVMVLIILPQAVAAAEPGFLKDIGPGDDRQDSPGMAVFVAMVIISVFLVGYVLHNPLSVDGEEDEPD